MWGSKNAGATGEHRASGRIGMHESELLGKLKAIPAGARRDLRRALSGDSNVRADLIRQFYEREDTRDLAEVLLDLEFEHELRLTVIELLDQLE